MNKKVRILIVDDHSAIRLAVKFILNTAGYDEIFEAEDGLTAISAIGKNHFDLIIIDLNLPNIDGLNVIKRIKTSSPESRILVFSSMISDVYLMRCYSAGANGFMKKDDDIESLPEIITNIMKGFSYFPNINNGDLLIRKESVNGNFLSCLSNRELAVFNSLVMGKSNLDIANEMFLSNKTISTYKARIFNKLGVSNIAELIEIYKETNG